LSVRTRKPARSGDLRGAVRFLLVVISMALLGFALVFIADGLDRLASRSGDVDGLVDKVLDRLLDRDIPRRERAEVPTPSTVKPSSTGGDTAPRAATNRADLDAPSPEDYAKESVGKRGVENAKQAPPTHIKTAAQPSTGVKKAAPAPTAGDTSTKRTARDLDALVERVTQGL